MPVTSLKLMVATLLLASARHVAAETITYTYDAQGRLVQVQRTGAPQGTETAKYSYDAADNRTRVLTTSTNAPSSIDTPQSLFVGQSLVSPDGRFRLTLQADGNVVLYGPHGVKWATNTAGKNAYRLTIQGDGNFVLFDPAGGVIWATWIYGHGPSRVTMQDDGNLVIYRLSDGAAVWASGTAERLANSPSIDTPQSLYAEESLVSWNGRFRLTFQSDGNVVLYGPRGVKWATNTNGRNAYRLTIQGNGNFVLFDPAGGVIWATWIYGHGPSRVTMQDDGNLVIYRLSDGAEVWASGTAE